MRKIIVITFLSMDGVMQAPGGPDEDTSGGFQWGGWTYPYQDDITNETMQRITAEPYDMLLGRKTYDIFAAYWPKRENDSMADLFNRIHKYVVTTSQPDLSWEKSVAIRGDVVSELKKLKAQEGPDLVVWGSSKLVQTLQQNGLIDIFHQWLFPVTLGSGKRLFENGIQPQQWQLVNSVVSTTGVIITSYVPGGEVKTGTMGE